MAKILIPYRDYTGEYSALNLRADDAILDADITTLVSAIDALTIGNRDTVKLTTTVDKDAGDGNSASTALAQREVKWLVRFEDSVTGDRYVTEIPCADLTLLSGGVDKLDLTADEGLDFANAFEASALSKNGNSVTVLEAIFVGRNT